MLNFNFINEPGKNRIHNKTYENEKILVSIITPYYNAGEYFEQTFNCVMNQTLHFFEWIIVNDGSTKQEDVELLKRLAKTDSRVSVFDQDNKGQSSARNQAIQKSNTDIIITLDADDLIEPYYIECLYLGLVTYPQAGWCYMDSVGFGHKYYIWCKKFSAGRMTFNNILVYSAAFRKSVLDKVGGYSEFEKHYDEDWELYLKLLSLNIRPVHMHIIGFWYRCRENGMMNTVRKDKILKKRSSQHIKNIAKHVNIKLKAMEYEGIYPEEAYVVNKYSDNRLLHKLMENYMFLSIIRNIYKIIRSVR